MHHPCTKDPVYFSHSFLAFSFALSCSFPAFPHSQPGCSLRCHCTHVACFRTRQPVYGHLWTPRPLATSGRRTGVSESVDTLPWPTLHDLLTGHLHFVQTNVHFLFLCASVDTLPTPAVRTSLYSKPGEEFICDSSQGFSSIMRHALSMDDLMRGSSSAPCSLGPRWAGLLSPCLCGSVNTHCEGAGLGAGPWDRGSGMAVWRSPWDGGSGMAVWRIV